tara:strand:+ start:19702 stop:19974 length:273 start_codon:yes stop_codon:yes gene_type:complete
MSKLNQVKIPVDITPKVRIKKLSDDKFGGEHPKDINEGFLIEGDIISKPKVGESFWVDNFATSTITEIVEDTPIMGVFKTLNSTYFWEVI